jgi:hypothetical protein
MASGFLEGSALALPKIFGASRDAPLQFFSLLYALVDFVSFGRVGLLPDRKFLHGKIRAT